MTDAEKLEAIEREARDSDNDPLAEPGELQLAGRILGILGKGA